MDKLFERFDTALHDAGYLAMGGQIIDATVVAAPRQKLTDEEKETIRGGGTPSAWSKAKRRQKDLDARWTIKRGRSKRSDASEMKAGVEIAVPVFGYKNHAGIDRRHGLIRRWTVTNAAAHDSRPFEGLLDPRNTASKVWADTAYRSARNEQPWRNAAVSRWSTSANPRDGRCRRIMPRPTLPARQCDRRSSTSSPGRSTG